MIDSADWYHTSESLYRGTVHICPRNGVSDVQCVLRNLNPTAGMVKLFFQSIEPKNSNHTLITDKLSL